MIYTKMNIFTSIIWLFLRNELKLLVQINVGKLVGTMNVSIHLFLLLFNTINE